ncbi:MAG: HAD family phosphatase [Nitrospirota bacterium]|nr:HAD family phosphatase [Nitrospirota bacterium]
MNKFKAILFDFDGVIGRTMEDNYTAWKNALSLFGIDITKEEYFLLEGVNTSELAKRFLVKNEKDISQAAAIVIAKEEYYLKNNNFSLYEGVEEIIHTLKGNGYLLAIVSAANFLRLSNTLYPALLKEFNTVITGDKIARGKPFPDPYLMAAKELGIEPSECLVVENAPIGIEAAKNANMYCIAITSTLDKKYLSKADKIIGNFSMLLDEIEPQ